MVDEDSLYKHEDESLENFELPKLLLKRDFNAIGFGLRTNPPELQFKTFLEWFEKYCIGEFNMTDLTLQFNVQNYLSNFKARLDNYADGLYYYYFNVVAFPAGVALYAQPVADSNLKDKFYPDIASLDDALMFVAGHSKIDPKSTVELMSAISEKGFSPNESEFYYFGEGVLILKGKNPDNWSKIQAKKDVDNIKKFKTNTLATNVKLEGKSRIRHGKK